MAFCLPPAMTSKFIAALKDGTINFEKLANMESGNRRAFLSDIVGKENAKDVNALFESKLLLQDWKKGMRSWVDTTAGLRPQARKDIGAKIDKMTEILSPADQKKFLADYAAKKLGAEVTPEQAKKITQLAQEAAKARETSSNTRFGMSTKYVEASMKLESYVKSLKPTSGIQEIIHNITSTMRNFTLMNPSTPIKAAIGQVEVHATEAIARRVAAGSAHGFGDPKEIQGIKNDLATFFKETQMDPSIMEDYESSGRLGEKNSFDVPEMMLDTNPVMRKLEAVTRAANKWTTKVAIDYEHVIMFTKFHQAAFVDAAHITASTIAKGEGLTGAALRSRTMAILNDAVRVKPETQIGTRVRAEAQAQAGRVVSINQTPLANLAMSVKNWLNGEFTMMSGKSVTIPFKIGLGDLLMPVAKIPANVIWNGMDNAGFGLPIAARDMIQGKMKIANPDATTRAEGLIQYGRGVQRLGRIVGVLGMSAFLSSLFSQDDFRTDRFGASYVKIGGYWVSLAYMSFVSPALAGMLTVKRDVNDPEDLVKVIGSYISGATPKPGELPGISAITDFDDALSSNNDKLSATAHYIAGRMVPAPVHNVTQNRPGNRLLFGAHGLETDEDVEQDKEDDAQRAEQRREEKQEYRAE